MIWNFRTNQARFVFALARFVGAGYGKPYRINGLHTWFTSLCVSPRRNNRRARFSGMKI